MNKEFIHYEQALELKELGFNEKCIGHFRGGEITLEPCLTGWLSELECCKNFEENGEPYFEDGYCSAPTYRQAFAFLRKLRKHTPQIEDEIDKEYSWTYWISGVRYINHPHQPYFNTYEEAELACLKKLIEIVKNK
jgi:hypothetical protein